MVTGSCSALPPSPLLPSSLPASGVWLSGTVTVSSAAGGVPPVVPDAAGVPGAAGVVGVSGGVGAAGVGSAGAAVMVSTASTVFTL